MQGRRTVPVPFEVAQQPHRLTCLHWNLQGLARLSLREFLVTVHEEFDPDLCCLQEFGTWAKGEAFDLAGFRIFTSTLKSG